MKKFVKVTYAFCFDPTEVFGNVKDLDQAIGASFAARNIEAIGDEANSEESRSRTFFLQRMSTVMEFEQPDQLGIKNKLKQMANSEYKLNK